MTLRYEKGPNGEWVRPNSTKKDVTPNDYSISPNALKQVLLIGSLFVPGLGMLTMYNAFKRDEERRKAKIQRKEFPKTEAWESVSILLAGSMLLNLLVLYPFLRKRKKNK